ncbi:MAG: tyrosine-type recombinase/integrase [Chthoniobacter sp.]|nr:tyrosine-type recombinase/integrase [Chthoniobacter sp.]
MKPLKSAVQDYVSLRRSLGFKLQWIPNLLADFVAFLKRQGADHITIPLALQWSQQNQQAKPVTVAKRLSMVRGFARYRSATDPRTQIPPHGLLCCRSDRTRPYLYTGDEVRHLLKATRELGGLDGLTHYCLFGLLSAAGLRISEALNLRLQDVDLGEGMLTVIGTKFGKSRLVPIHPSTQKVLTRYARERDRTCRGSVTHFFVNHSGDQLNAKRVQCIFRRLSRQIGIRDQTASHGPRLHDFRHTFAVGTLVNWYRSGQDIEQRLPVLSTYLGHARVSDTYWYLSACPELLGLAVNRFERHWEDAQ